LRSGIFTLHDFGPQGLFVPAHGLFAVLLITAAPLIPVLLALGFGEGIGVLGFHVVLGDRSPKQFEQFDGSCISLVKAPFDHIHSLNKIDNALEPSPWRCEGGMAVVTK